MKKLILSIFLLAITSSTVFADDEIKNIFLEDNSLQNEESELFDAQPKDIRYDKDITIKEDNKDQINLKLPQSIVSKSLFEYKNAKTEELDNTLFLRASKYSGLEYEISPTSSVQSTKIGSFSYGTTYSSYIDTAQLENTTRFFTRYDTKHFAISSAYGKTLLTNGGDTKDYLYFAPEIKLGKGFALRDTLRHEVGQNRQKNEVVLLYSPHFKKNSDTNLQFELGAGRTFYEGQDSTTSVRFSTSFKL